MNLEQFTETVSIRVQERTGSLVEPALVEKNNQVVQAGIAVSREGCSTRTVLGMEAYYGQYIRGEIGLGETIEDICLTLESSAGSLEGWEEDLSDYGKLKDKILFRLVSREKNGKLLDEIPHIPFLDMEIVFWLLMGKNECGQTGMLIRREIFEGWPVDEGALFAQAKGNMLQLYPPSIKSIEDVMREILRGGMAGEAPICFSPAGRGEEAAPMYVFTNRQGIYGAGAVLYPGVLKEFADSQGSDFIILPSSIHEVILVPYRENLDFDYLRKMVGDINGSEVPPEDQLSDQVYLYRREEDAIRIAG